MKKRIALIFGMLLLLVVILAACSGGEHTHKYEKQRTEPTCEQDGQEYYKCSCGDETNFRVLEAKGHKAGEPTMENVKDPTCTVDGSYDVVTKCVNCEGEISRVTETVAANGHVNGEQIEENYKEPTCTVDGSYDIVTKCETCGEISKSETILIKSTGHIGSEPVMENYNEPTCTADGSCDMVVYCVICSDEIDRELFVVESEGHKNAEAVKENEKAVTCTTDGEYDSVVYCSVCKEEQSRETVVTPSKGHKPGNPYEDNRKPANCLSGGSFDTVVKCTACGEEISRVTTTSPSSGHSAGTPKKENVVSATCTVDGSYDYVTRCTVCNDIVTKETITEKASHDFKNGKCTVCGEDFPYTREGDKIYFGEYPQTLVSDTSVTTSLNSLANGRPSTTNANGWTSFEYYINGVSTDFMWYKDVELNGERYRGVYYVAYRPNTGSSAGNASTSYQDDNGFRQNYMYWFKYEPISWTILEESGGRALILCDLIIDSQEFDYKGEEQSYKNNYAASTIRAWLNDSFYQTAFDDTQRALIEATTVDNSAESTGVTPNSYACENTNDKIFLLSCKDVTTYLEATSSREKQATDYACCQGAYIAMDGDGAWILRSPDKSNALNVREVSDDGTMVYTPDASLTSGGIVPALYITFID